MQPAWVVRIGVPFGGYNGTITPIGADAADAGPDASFDVIDVAEADELAVVTVVDIPGQDRAGLRTVRRRC